MCGIVGIMDWSKGAICQKEMGIFMQMLHCNAVRGMHGTGIFAVDRDGENHRLRAGGPPHVLVGSKEFSKFENWVGGKYVQFMVGHNRYATRGGIGTAQSHPFRDGDIILVHNGTLESFSHLPDASKYNVDSEAICHAFSVEGAEKTVPTLRGAWAFVWWDAVSKTLNLLRNKERPLYVARCKKQETIAFASEYSMLSWILSRNEIWEYEIEMLPDNQLHSYRLDSMKPHVKELKGKAIYSADKGWAGYGGTAREEAVGTGKEEVEADKKVVQLPLLQTKPHGKSSSNGTGSTSTKRGSLQANSSSGGTSRNVGSGGGRGYWVAAESIHSITKAKKVTVLPLEWKAISSGDKEKELFEIKALADEFPDVEFICYVKGQDSVSVLMEAQHGIRADVKSILRSMNFVAEHPHKVYLHNPEPLWIKEPEVPEHAHHGD